MPSPLLLQMNFFAHPEDWYPAYFVIAGVIVGVVYLSRLIFGGAKRSVGPSLPSKSYERILIPSGPRLPLISEEAVSLACSLASPNGATVFLSYLIEVPRSLAPDAAMPDEEAEAKRVLDAGAAAVRACGLSPTMQVRKCRGAVDETVRALTEEKIDLLVLVRPADSDIALSRFTISDDTEAARDYFTRIPSQIARRVPCEMVVARASRLDADA